jgi:polyisoprenoid-binding protein YceI
MTFATQQDAPARDPRRPPRKRHWWRWILASVIVLVVVVVAAIGLFIKLQPTLSPLALPTAAAKAPVGLLDGTWDVAGGSVAGFRVQESFAGFSNDVVGRTSAVTGGVTIANGQVSRATFRVDLTTIKVGGKSQPQFAKSLDTQDHPSATFTLTHPITLNHAFASGSTVTTTATGQLAMHGTSRLVTFTISARHDGALMQAAGAIPIEFSDWGIDRPQGYGSLASLADHGVAEFLLVLDRE